MEKNLGSRVAKGISELEKLKVDITSLKGYEKLCKELDEVSSLNAILRGAYQDVVKFLNEPDVATVRDIREFFKYREKYVAITEKSYSDYMKLSRSLLDLWNAQIKSKNKNAEPVAKDTYQILKNTLPEMDPNGKSHLIGDVKKFRETVKEKYDEMREEQLEVLKKKHDAEVKLFQTRGMTDWKEIYAAIGE